MKTRCRDRDGNIIRVGDILHVEEYPGKYVGGSLDFEGVVSVDNGRAVVTYYDIGEEESYPVSAFPVDGRHIWPEEWRYEYWKIAMLGGEPDERLWKEELYEAYFDPRRNENSNEER